MRRALACVALSSALLACDGAQSSDDAGADGASDVAVDASSDAMKTSDAGVDAYVPPSLVPSGPLDLTNATDASFTNLHITSDAGMRSHRERRARHDHRIRDRSVWWQWRRDFLERRDHDRR